MTILLAGIIIHAYFNLDKKEKVNRLFVGLMFLTLIISFLEILSVLLNSGVDIRFITAHKMVDTLGFALTPLVPIVVVLYVYNRTNPYQKVSPKKLYRFYQVGPASSGELLKAGSKLQLISVVPPFSTTGFGGVPVPPFQ